MKRITAVLIPALVLLDGHDLTPSDAAYPEKAEKGRIVSIGTMNSQRFAHTSTLLPDGRVLIAGGQNGGALASVEVFDPAFNNFISTGTMSVARAGHSATLIRDGKVLITGGYDERMATSSEAWLYQQ
jgi:hypothetical protein